MKDIRWKQRFENYTTVFNMLKTEIDNKEIDSFTDLEQAGLAKNFELCFELLWKTIKDYLQFEGVEINISSPKNVLKLAATSGLLQSMDVNGDILMLAHKARNELVHIYDQKIFQSTLADIKKTFLPEMLKVDNFFMVQAHD